MLTIRNMFGKFKTVCFYLKVISCLLLVRSYVLIGKFLDSVTHHSYLGVELSRNLDWVQHVNNKVMKANRSLGFFRRKLSSCPKGVKEAAYTAIVRLHLEFPTCTNPIIHLFYPSKFCKSLFEISPGT